ncbi:hypothetical protein J2046_002039 [Rhizobium petrolearium]|nr:hypothetical protein [Neorhizobium petrolearium]
MTTPEQMWRKGNMGLIRSSGYGRMDRLLYLFRKQRHCCSLLICED